MRPKILLVDDETVNLQLLKQTLRKEYDLFFAKNGKAALALINPSLDLILLDVMMPEMDGYEMCRILKENPDCKEIPVIFLTAKSELADELRGFEVGAVDYITKPISPPLVQARVRAQIRIKQAEDRIRGLNQNLERANRFIRNTFGRYMSDEVVTQILDSPEGLRLGGEKKVVTVMMTDLRGFTALSEQLDPQTVVTILNMYLDTMTEIILKYNGTIIEFLGDGILTLFGAPVSREDDPQRAVACALEMQRAMPGVNARNRSLGFPQLQMGGGINTGAVIAGNIGSEKRSKYGVVGSTINLTSRIESYTVGGQILISESTRKGCGSLLRIDGHLTVMPKGVSHSITLYHVGGIDPPYAVFLPPPVPPDYCRETGELTVCFSILQEKEVGKAQWHGQIIGLSTEGAEIRTDQCVDPPVELKLTLFRARVEITRELFAKVTGTSPEQPPRLRVAFTSVPREAREVFGEVLPPAP